MEARNDNSNNENSTSVNPFASRAIQDFLRNQEIVKYFDYHTLSIFARTNKQLKNIINPIIKAKNTAIYRDQAYNLALTAINNNNRCDAFYYLSFVKDHNLVGHALSAFDTEKEIEELWNLCKQGEGVANRFLSHWNVLKYPDLFKKILNDCATFGTKYIEDIAIGHLIESVVDQKNKIILEIILNFIHEKNIPIYDYQIIQFEDAISTTLNNRTEETDKEMFALLLAAYKNILPKDLNLLSFPYELLDAATQQKSGETDQESIRYVNSILEALPGNVLTHLFNFIKNTWATFASEDNTEKLSVLESLFELGIFEQRLSKISNSNNNNNNNHFNEIKQALLDLLWILLIVPDSVKKSQVLVPLTEYIEKLTDEKKLGKITALFNYLGKYYAATGSGKVTILKQACEDPIFHKYDKMTFWTKLRLDPTILACLKELLYLQVKSSPVISNKFFLY